MKFSTIFIVRISRSQINKFFFKFKLYKKYYIFVTNWVSRAVWYHSHIDERVYLLFAAIFAARFSLPGSDGRFGTLPIFVLHDLEKIKFYFKIQWKISLFKFVCCSWNDDFKNQKMFKIIVVQETSAFPADTVRDCQSP